MSAHMVGLHRPVNIQLSGVIRFHAASERQAWVPPSVESDSVLVCCQEGARPKTGPDCAACTRFLGWEKGRGGLRVRCGWSDRDPVRDCMTLASALAVTRPGACCEDADRLARDRHVEHLLVVERLRLIGVVTRRDLRLGGLVRERMSREVFALFSDATLGEALGAMVELRVGFLPVIGERFVIGAVTRTDLARVGVPAHLFAA